METAIRVLLFIGLLILLGSVPFVLFVIFIWPLIMVVAGQWGGGVLGILGAVVGMILLLWLVMSLIDESKSR